MKSLSSVLLKAILLILVFISVSFARPVSKKEANLAAKGWLNNKSNHLTSPVDGKIRNVIPFAGQGGQTLFFVVNYHPAGYVVLSSDDLLEPVVAFSNKGYFDPTDSSPLSDSIKVDMKARHCVLKKTKKEKLKNKDSDKSESKTKKQEKWAKYILDSTESEPIKDAGVTNINDVYVWPLVQTQWGQSHDGYENYCFNYYTPGNYVCGCVATAMAQIMRYHEYPTAGIGHSQYDIYVDEVLKTNYYTRGGDGNGGPYNWSQMPSLPWTTDLAERQMIGALCYDAGLSVNMMYTQNSSSAFSDRVSNALKNTFMYSNAVYSHNYGYSDISDELPDVINPNLDAGYPCYLGIVGDGGHAILVDGYGHSVGTPYHHINMGWYGQEDLWYNLPDIGAGYNFNIVDECIYNIFPQGTGEIISGRVINQNNEPVQGVTVTLEKGSTVYQDTTNSVGIFDFAKLPSNTNFTLEISSPDLITYSQSVSTGKSMENDFEVYCGNVWLERINVTEYLGEPDQYELNDSYDLATVITTDGTPQQHSIYPSNDEDWLQFNIAKPSNVVVKSSAAEFCDIALSLYSDPESEPILTDGSGGTGTYAQAIVFLEPGNYYFKINDSGYDNTIEDYSATVLGLPVDINDDDTVNYAELASLNQKWQDSGCGFENDFCEGADINMTGTVDMEDVFLVAQYWLETY